MSAQLLSGPPAAVALLAQAQARAARLSQVPQLVILRVGEDPASVSYVAGKAKKAEEIGLHSRVIVLPEQTTQAELLSVLTGLNADPAVSGILVQLPLPAQFQEDAVLKAIHPDKDVDGFHPVNVGRLWSGQVGSGQPGLAPCTPLGIMAMLDFYGLKVAGKHAVVVGRSQIVGRPLAGLLLNADATVTIAHSRTPDLAAITREAEVLCVAVGRPHLITPDMVRPGAVVIDVGINRQEREGKKARLLGDVHPEVAQVASAMTPVPGGVGPMTIAQLLANTVTAAEIQSSAAARGA